MLPTLIRILRGGVSQLLTAASNGTRQGLEVLLEMREHLLGIVLSGVASLTLVLVGTIGNLVSLGLRKADNLLLRGNRQRLLLSIGDDGISLGGSAC